MTDCVADLLSYIDQSPTPYHAVAESIRRLEAAGYQPLEEAAAWVLSPGDRRYVVRGGGSLAAFEVGKKAPAEAGFRVVGAHTDSPNLRIKPEADVRRFGYHQLAVEPYGGVLLHTWFDRDLSLAGRAVFKKGSGTETVLVDFKRPLLRVPNLAIHLFREIHQEGLKVNQQQHLAPLLGLGDDADFVDLLCAEAAGAKAGGKSGKKRKAGDLLAFDLMAYDTQPSVRSGGERRVHPRAASRQPGIEPRGSYGARRCGPTQGGCRNAHGRAL